MVVVAVVAGRQSGLAVVVVMGGMAVVAHFDAVDMNSFLDAVVLASTHNPVADCTDQHAMMVLAHYSEDVDYMVVVVPWKNRMAWALRHYDQSYCNSPALP